MINRSDGGISIRTQVKNLPTSAVPYRLSYSKANSCLYTLHTNSLGRTDLGKIDLGGNYIRIGQLSVASGTLYFAEGIAVNRVTGKVYVSASLDGDKPDKDYYSETLMEVDTTNARCTYINVFRTGRAKPEADIMTFGDDGSLYFADGDPGENKGVIYRMDLDDLSAPDQIYSSSYFPVGGFTVSEGNLYYTTERQLYAIDLSDKSRTLVKTLHNSSAFNGNITRGLSWFTICPENPEPRSLDMCYGDTLQLTARFSGDAYHWISDEETREIEVTAGGTYWVDITMGNCTLRDSVKVLMAPKIVADAGADTTACLGDTIQIGTPGSDNYAYFWTPTDEVLRPTEPQPKVVFQGFIRYTVKVSSPGTGCSAYDTVEISVREPLTFKLRDTVLCLGETLRLDLSKYPYSYTWPDGSTGPVYESSGETSIIVKANDGTCKAADTLDITYEDVPAVRLPSDTFHCSGQALRLEVFSPNTTYIWEPGGQTSPVIDINRSGIYTLNATNRCGTTRHSVTVATRNCNCLVHVPNVFTPNDDELNDHFSPLLNCPLLDYELRIYNRWGEQLFMTQNSSEAWDGSYLDKPVPESVYFWILRFTGQENSNAVKEVVSGTVTVLR
ncbi:MAG: gliding motility-associated C-terminal domain-containing protein [Bacteroidia bacterium]|nr:gliding motility-associated C-terminal domain-containing protein [Bacteroidia bacterium]